MAGFFLVFLPFSAALPKMAPPGTSSWSDSSVKPKIGVLGLGGPVGFLGLEMLRPWERLFIVGGEWFLGGGCWVGMGTVVIAHSHFTQGSVSDICTACMLQDTLCRVI